MPVSFPASFGSSNLCPVQVFYQLSGKHQRQQQSLMQWSIAAPLLDGEVTVRIRLGGALQGLPSRSLVLGRGDTMTCEAITFVPRTAGNILLRFQITVETAAGVPQGRWHGEIPVIVEEAPANVQVARDMYVMNSPGNPLQQFAGMLSNLSTLPASQAMLELKTDASFSRRLGRPSPAYAAPAGVLESVQASEQPTLALVHFQGLRNPSNHIVAVQTGKSCSFGRGGDKSPTWRVRPAPYDYDGHAMLSGDHFAVDLRAGFAWGVDYSCNGTWLNGERLERMRPEMLREGDEIHLLRHKLLPLRLFLAADQNGVHGVHMRRSDRLGERISYLLTLGRAFVPALLPEEQSPACWLRWHHGPRGALLLRACAGQARLDLMENQEAVAVGDYRVRWKSWRGSADQNDLLSAFAAVG